MKLQTQIWGAYFNQHSFFLGGKYMWDGLGDRATNVGDEHQQHGLEERPC